MKGQDLGADWGNDAVPVGGDLGADWGNDQQTARRKPPERAPVADTAQQRTAQAVAAFMAQKQRTPSSEAGASEASKRIENDSPWMQTARMLMPRTAAIYDDRGVDKLLPQAWAGAKDALTLPGRTVSGLFSGIGSALMSTGSNDPAKSWQDTFDAVRRGMSDPGGNVAEVAAKDPLMLPMLASGGLLSGGTALPAMGRIGANTALMTAKDAADSASVGGAMPTREDVGRNAMFAGLGEGVGMGLSRLPLYGNAAMSSGKNLLVSQIKPSQSMHTAEAAGLTRGLDAGLLPEIAGYGTLSVPGIAKRYEKRLLDPVTAKFDPILDDLVSSGFKARTKPAIDAAGKQLDEAIASGKSSIDPTDEAREAIEWVRKRAGIPDTREAIQAIREGAEEILPDYAISPKVAHFRKSQLLKEAHKDPLKANARVEASEGAGQNFRSQLVDQSQAYSDLMSESAPILGMEAAMNRAAARQNRNPVSLLSGLNPLAWAQEIPAAARGVYDAGRFMRGLGGLNQAARVNPGLWPYLLQAEGKAPPR